MKNHDCDPRLIDTDKNFWHKYLSFYDKCFGSSLSKDVAFDILEIGVFNSKSIEYWRKKFPNSSVVGCDILYNSNWFMDESTKYLCFDQSNVRALKEAIANLPNPRLLIDDGSHQPLHQLIFLDLATSRFMQSAPSHRSFVVIEDIHTCLPDVAHSISPYKFLFWKIKYSIKKLRANLFASADIDTNVYLDALRFSTPLGILLVAQKISSGSQSFREFEDQVHRERISHSAKQLIIKVMRNCLMSSKISIYKRSVLPDKCYRCGSNIFHPGNLSCIRCGANAYKFDDSMSVCLEFEGSH